MAAIYLSFITQQHPSEASSSVAPVPSPPTLSDLRTVGPISFKASPATPISHALTPEEEKVAIGCLRNLQSTLAKTNPLIAYFCDVIAQKKKNPSTEVLKAASLIYLHAQNNKLLLLAYFLYNQFGLNLFTHYREHYHFLKRTHLGMTDANFDRLILSEIQYAQDPAALGKSPPQLMFDGFFFHRRSREFIEFWNHLEAPYDDFAKHLSTFPYKGMINHLQAQYDVWKEFQNDPRTKNFPIQEIWRFGIDRNVENLGPCAFESEPGYINAFLRGMLFALKTALVPKDDRWYNRLHEETSSSALFPISSGTYDVNHKTLWDPQNASFANFSMKLRTTGVSWNYEHLDHDPVGMNEVKKRTFNVVDGTFKTIGCAKINSQLLAFRLKKVMEHYQKLVKEANSDIERLLVYLAHARQLSLDHYYDDVNARKSHLTLLSWIKSDQTLPFPLLPDQSIFDGNCPESVVYRYLEGCVNFIEGGHGPCCPKMSQKKRLTDLDLSDYPELDALKEKLKPLVLDKKWESVVPSYVRTYQSKRTKREYSGAILPVAKRLLLLRRS